MLAFSSSRGAWGGFAPVKVSCSEFVCFFPLRSDEECWVQGEQGECSVNVELLKEQTGPEAEQ